MNQRSQKGNKIFWDNWKWKDNISKVWDETKAVPRGKKFIVIEEYIKKKISNTLILQLKEVEKEQTKPEVSRRKDIIRIRTKMNEIDNRKTIESNSKTKSWFFENINNVTNLYFS